MSALGAGNLIVWTVCFFTGGQGHLFLLQTQPEIRRPLHSNAARDSPHTREHEAVQLAQHLHNLSGASNQDARDARHLHKSGIHSKMNSKMNVTSSVKMPLHLHRDALLLHVDSKMFAKSSGSGAVAGIIGACIGVIIIFLF